MKPSRWMHWTLTCLSIAATASPLRADPPAPVAEAAMAGAGDVVLAERFCEMAMGLAPAQWRQKSALLHAANRLNPAERRYPHLLLDVMLQAGDVHGAIDVLKEYRQAAPDDRVAQIQLIDLYMSQLQSPDLRLAYAKQILGKPSVPDEVRSHAALMAVEQLMERGQSDQVMSMLGQALRLNPLNNGALWLKYQQQIAHNAPAFERISTLLGMLRSNPAQVTIQLELAHELADAGMLEPSLFWFSQASALLPRQNSAMTPADSIAYACELFLSGQAPQARTIMEGVLKSDRTEPKAWFLRATMDMAADNAEDLKKTQQAAVDALTARLVQVRRQFVQAPATRPNGAPAAIGLTDLDGDPTLLKNANNPALTSAYVSAAADLAWFQIYFQGASAGPAKITAILRQLAPKDDPTLARLEGWQYLLESRNDEAKLKLSAIAQLDPWGKVGLIRLAGHDPAEQARADADANQVFNENPSGVVGAMLYTAFRDHGAKLVASSQTLAIQSELDHFPRAWMDILVHPEMFYAIHAEPMQISHEYHQPLFVNITLENLSDYDLTISSDGVIRPDLWLDAQFRGLSEVDFPLVASDTLEALTVLPARQGVTQTLRLDQGVMFARLMANPGATIQVSGTVRTNPLIVGKRIVSSPAGYQVQFTPRVMDRIGFQVDNESTRQGIYTVIRSGPPSPKMDALDLLAAFCSAARANPGDTMLAGLAPEFMTAIRSRQEDPVPAVAAWADYVTAQLDAADPRLKVIQKMLADKQWQRRMLGVWATQLLPSPRQLDLLVDRVRSDPEPLVQELAQARIDALGRLAARQPATAPATGPAQGRTTTAPALPAGPR